MKMLYSHWREVPVRPAWILKESAPLGRIADRPRYAWIVVATVCVGAFMGQLDASIVSLVLPTLEDTFHSHVSQVQWVAISYLLVLTGLLTPLGRVADHLGRKALYTLGFLVFTAGSVFCGLASGLIFLIAARAIQGLGAALLQANSVAIITAAVPKRQLGRAVGIQGTAQALGLAIGPTVGGILIAWLGWRWVFLINLPVGLIGAGLAILTLPKSGHSAGAVRFNWLGAFLLPVAITALLLALSFVHLAVVFLPIAIILAAAFMYSERRSPDALLGGQILRAPGLPSGMVAGLLSYTMLFGGLFAAPILLERVFETGTERAGLILSSVPVLLGSVALLGGLLMDRAGPRLPTVGGMTLATVGLGILWWSASGQLGWLLVGLMLLGLGAGLFIPANNASVMGAAPRSHLGVAGGMLNMMRGLGTSFGVALVGLILALRVGTASTGSIPSEAVVGGIRVTILVLISAAIIAGLLSIRRQRGAIGDSPRMDDIL